MYVIIDHFLLGSASPSTEHNVASYNEKGILNICIVLFSGGMECTRMSVDKQNYLTQQQNNNPLVV